MQVKEQAHRLGFSQVGIAPCEIPARFDDYVDALIAGRHGALEWLSRGDLLASRGDPGLLLDGCRSLVLVAVSYAAEPAAELPAGHGRVARYARGADYHRVLGDRLEELASALRELGGEARVGVDGLPVMEVAQAERAGLGWAGRNTLLLNRSGGTWWLLGEILTTLELEPDEPVSAHCGTCTRCLEACPTGAFRAPYELVVERCLSYQTIEQKGTIPSELRPQLGEWLFGCDVCQEVCPWSQSNPPAGFPELAPQLESLDLVGLLGLDAAGFKARFGGTPLARPKRRGLLRNACVVLGNRGDRAAIPALAAALGDPEPLIRAHAAWALGRLGGPAARAALAQAQAHEADELVKFELTSALGQTELT